MPRSEADPNNPWLYKPSLVAAIIIAHIYLITTLIHIYQAAHYSTRFCIPLIIGGLWETIGYAIRAASTSNESSLALYATPLTLIVLAPACMYHLVLKTDVLDIQLTKVASQSWLHSTTCSLAEFCAPSPRRESPRP